MDISKMPADELEHLLKAVLHRYKELFPEWEMTVISLRKDETRNEQIDNMICLLQKMKI